MTEDTIKNLVKLTRDVDTSGNLTNDGLTVAYASNTYAASTFAGNTYASSTFTSNAYFQDNKSSGPTITSIHPSANVTPGDTVYIDGTGFDRSANVILISNTNVDVVVPKGNITFNNSANLTFLVPAGPIFLDEDYDVRVTIDNTGLAAVQLDALDFFNTTGFQGRYFGYTSGGQQPTSPLDNTIDKFPFPSDSNATDVGDLTVARHTLVGQSSDTSGYTSGGVTPSPSPVVTNTIDKFPFASDANATDVGDLTAARRGPPAGQSSTTSGYTSGGSIPTSSPLYTNVIDKFPFSSDGNATDVGDLTVARHAVAGQSSDASGYTSGGFSGPPNTTHNIIDKFPFSSDANATDVGDLTVARQIPTGQSSTTSGYTSGGFPSYNIIDKFPFSSDANATDVGDLTVTRNGGAGQSSTASGYTSGGSSTSDVIDKFPFSSDANATDVGDLSLARSNVAGQQI
jgi:hypothetical protein